MNKYPYTTSTATLLQDLQEIQRAREDDVRDRDNLQNIFITGRKAMNVPTSSTDTSSNREDDFNWDSSYIYYWTLSGSTLVARRIASSTF